MPLQLCLDVFAKFFRKRRKRTRCTGRHGSVVFDLPTYVKVYTVYQYDRAKYMNIYKKLHELARKHDPFIIKRVSPYRVLRLCYIRDKDGLPFHMGDEQHIYRIRALQNIYHALFVAVNVYDGGVRSENGLKIYPDEGQAEIEGTWQLSIKKRIKMHLYLLRLLRQDLPTQEAVAETRRIYGQN